mgnify:CR=1 FL=1
MWSPDVHSVKRNLSLQYDSLERTGSGKSSQNSCKEKKSSITKEIYLEVCSCPIYLCNLFQSSGMRRMHSANSQILKELDLWMNDDSNTSKKAQRSIEK